MVPGCFLGAHTMASSQDTPKWGRGKSSTYVYVYIYIYICVCVSVCAWGITHVILKVYWR